MRAQRAGDASDDGAWPRLAQGALGLGAPGLTQNADLGPPSDQLDGPHAASLAAEPTPDAASRRTSSPAVSNPRRPHAELPSSAGDHEGMYRGLLWVAWAIEECSRAFTRVSCRLANVEKRLDQLESAGERVQPAPEAPVAARDRPFERLEARVDERYADTCGRIDALEDGLRQLDFIPLKLSNLQRTVDQLGSSQPRRTAAGSERPEASPAVDFQLRELRRELAATQRRLAGLEAKASQEHIAVLVDDAVRRHADRLTVQPSADSDLEAVYRELDGVAEFVAAQSTAAAQGLERIAPLEAAVLELRRELARAVGDVRSNLGTGSADSRLDDVETRLRRLELSSRKASRLYSALAGAVQVRDPAEEAFGTADPARNGG